MISLPSYNFPLSFKQFFKNYLTPRSTSKFFATEPKTAVDLKKSEFLIISDDPFTSFVFGRSIEKWNGQVDIATTHSEALANLRNTDYTMILLDVKTDISSAIAFYKSLAEKTSEETLTLALVDEKTEHLSSKLLEEGFSGTFSKEIKPSELSQKLSEII